MKEKITPYLEHLLTLPAIQSQYVQSAMELDSMTQSAWVDDPLDEEGHEVVKGLVCKYPGRALVKVSYRCAAHCRFCTRYRQIGDPHGDLSETDIAAILAYLGSHPEIQDVILSGGDPFYTPKQTSVLLDGLAGLDSVKVMRIGTRLPLQNPVSFQSDLLQALLRKCASINQQKPLYVLVHIAHPDELTPQAVAVLKQFRQLGIQVFSQTVFLKGINDDHDCLKRLFTELFHLGVLPYYIYRCDFVKGVGHFVADFQREKQIMSQLVTTLSGLACPTYVVEGDGFGKVPVALDFWPGADASYLDFKGERKGAE